VDPRGGGRGERHQRADRRQVGPSVSAGRHGRPARTARRVLEPRGTRHRPRSWPGSVTCGRPSTGPPGGSAGSWPARARR
jgi:hypothetical protein